MIIAWVLSMITTITTLVINVEHSTALQIRLLAIEQEAHTAFVATEKQIDQCEAQLSNTTSLSVSTENDAVTGCEITVVDSNAIGELIQIRALGNAVVKKSRPSDSHLGTQTQLEIMVYRDKRDHTLKRLSWRVIWSAMQSIKPQIS